MLKPRGGIDPEKLYRASLKVANFKNQLFSQQNKIRATKVTNLLIAKSLSNINKLHQKDERQGVLYFIQAKKRKRKK